MALPKMVKIAKILIFIFEKWKKIIRGYLRQNLRQNFDGFFGHQIKKDSCQKNPQKYQLCQIKILNI
jgi:hypothetical protein